MIRAKTNYGEATVSIYTGYKGCKAIGFQLDIGGFFGGWDVNDLIKTFKHHTLCLDGGSKLECTNIQDVLASVVYNNQDGS